MTSDVENKIIKNLISDDMCQFFCSYMDHQIDRKAILEPFISSGILSNMNFCSPCTQVQDSIGFYGSTVFDSLGVILLKQLIKELKKPLVFTYSFARKYFEGQELPHHSDRSSCEISLTLCLGWDGDDIPWPIWMQFDEGDKSVDLNVGDAYVYNGSTPHWRNELKHKKQYQLFLHYNMGGDFHPTNKWDGRVIHGIPKFDNFN